MLGETLCEQAFEYGYRVPIENISFQPSETAPSKGANYEALMNAISTIRKLQSEFPTALELAIPLAEITGVEAFSISTDLLALINKTLLAAGISN